MPAPPEAPHILIVEDNAIEAEILDQSMKDLGYVCEIAPSAEQALEFLDRFRVELIFVDIGLPGARGDELIEIVSRQYPRVIIIAVSADADPGTILSVLREHKAYDFLTKPFRPGQARELVERALKIVPLRQGGLSFLESEQQYYANMFAAFDWKQEIRARHTDRVAGNIMQELYRTLFQGSGPGALLASVQLLLSSRNPEDGTFPADPEIQELLEVNTRSFARMSECIEAAVEVFGIKRNVENLIPVQEVCRTLHGFAADVAARLESTERKFNIGPMPVSAPGGLVYFDAPAMEIVVQELLVNAAKFSRPGDSILVLLNLVGTRHLELKVINPAYAIGRESKFSEELESMLFAPFFRLAREEPKDFPEEKFGYGLGLSVVRKLVELHQGSATLVHIKNYTRTDSFDDICATVRLPLQEPE